MDILVLCNCFIIFLPFFIFLFLIVSRLKLVFVNKKFLINAPIAANALAFLMYLFDFKTKNYFDIFDYSVLNFGNLTFEIGFKIDENNILFLLVSSILFALISIYIKHYFNSKKQFIFVKQRYITYFNLLIFNTFCFLTSLNLLTNFIFWTLQGIIIFLFCFMGVKKSYTKINIVRFQRITLLGDFLLFILFLMLLKYEILSQSYIYSTCLKNSDFDLLVSYAFGMSSGLEFKVMMFCILGAALTKFITFPFNCYYSFLSNCENIICYPIYLINSIFGSFLLLKAIPFVCMYTGIEKCITIYCIASILILLILLLFEKNVKIIFGNLFAILNCAFLPCILFYETNYKILAYFCAVSALLMFLGFLFLKDKNNFKRRIINIQKGFLTERLYILIFERATSSVCDFLEFIKYNLINKIIYFPYKAFKFLSNFLAYKHLKINKNNDKSALIIIKYILILFSIFILFVLLLSLFEGSRW